MLTRKVEELINQHGSSASQFLVDQMVAAVKCGDVNLLKELDETLSELDKRERQRARYEPR